MKQLLLSIVIPTFNRASKLEAQLKSLHQLILKSQFEENIELLVSDNCSTDSTQSIIKHFSSLERKYIFSSYRNEINIGSDRNGGQVILRSKGRFAWYLADDDIAHEDAIDHIFQSLSENQEIGLCFVNFYHEPLSKIPAINIANGDDVLVKNINEFVSETMCAESMCSSLIFRKSLLSRDSLVEVKEVASYEHPLGGGYPHLWWSLQILENHKALVIKAPLFTVIHPGVRETREGASMREDTVDFYLEAHLNFLQYTSHLFRITSGNLLRIKIYRLSINENLNQIIYHKITTKNLGYNFQALRLALPAMVRKFYFSPSFWIIHVPLLLLPSYVAKFFEPLRWKYLTLRGLIGNIIRRL